MRRIGRLLILPSTLLAFLISGPALAGMSSSADLGPNGMSSSADIAPKGMSSSAIVTLEALLKAGDWLQAVAFPSIAPWVIVSDQTTYYEDHAWYDAVGLAAVLDDVQRHDVGVQAMAVTGDGRWVVATDKGPLFSGGDVATDDGLWLVLVALSHAGVEVDSLSLGARGGYVVVAGGRSIANGALPYGLKRTLQYANQARVDVEHVSLEGYRWAVTHDRGVSHSYNPALSTTLRDLRRVGFDVGPIGLTATGGFVVTNHAAFDVGPVGFDDGPIGYRLGERGFEIGPIGFEVGPIGAR